MLQKCKAGAFVGVHGSAMVLGLCRPGVCYTNSTVTTASAYTDCRHRSTDMPLAEPGGGCAKQLRTAVVLQRWGDAVFCPLALRAGLQGYASPQSVCNSSL